MVPAAGLEPARPYGQQILSLQRIPFRHAGSVFLTILPPYLDINYGRLTLYTGIVCQIFNVFVYKRGINSEATVFFQRKQNGL